MRIPWIAIIILVVAVVIWFKLNKSDDTISKITPADRDALRKASPWVSPSPMVPDWLFGWLMNRQLK